MKVGLVLGAGGSVGASWLIGALDALAAETGWDPADADHIVGTSAGAVVGCLLAEGVAPAYMGAYLTGRVVDDVVEMEERTEDLAEKLDGSRLGLHRGLPSVGPGSLRLGLRTLLRAHRHPPGAVLAGWLPRGIVSTQPIRDLVSHFLQDDWPSHDAFWAVTADYDTGKRTVFGRPGSPPATTAADAVAASCAIPGFYRPVEINGRCYVDGGICSASNADLLAGADLDLVVCLNPMSSLAPVSGGSPGDRFGALMRAASRRRLTRELARIEQAGIPTLVLEPTEADLRTMGWNFMASGRRTEVVDAAVKNTGLALRELRGTDQLMPGRRRSRRSAGNAQRARARLTEDRAASARSARSA